MSGQTGDCICGSALRHEFQLFEMHVEWLGMPYVGVVKEVETDAMFARVKQFVEVQAQLGYRWIHVHASTPCSSGSPLKTFWNWRFE